MEIREFERAFRAAMESTPTQPALAASGIVGGIDVQLPEEFQAAAKTLSGRTGHDAPGNSILRAMAAQWA